MPENIINQSFEKLDMASAKALNAFHHQELTDSKAKERRDISRLLLEDAIKITAGNNDAMQGAREVDNKTRILRMTTSATIATAAATAEMNKLMKIGEQSDGSSSFNELNNFLKKNGSNLNVDFNFKNDYYAAVNKLQQIETQFTDKANFLESNNIQKITLKELKVDARTGDAYISYENKNLLNGKTETFTRNISHEIYKFADVGGRELTVSEYLETLTNSRFMISTTMKSNGDVVKFVESSEKFKNLNLKSLSDKEIKERLDSPNINSYGEAWEKLAKSENFEQLKQIITEYLDVRKQVNAFKLRDVSRKKLKSVVKQRAQNAQQGNDAADGARYVLQNYTIVSNTVLMPQKINNTYHNLNEKKLVRKLKKKNLSEEKRQKLQQKYDKLYGENGKITKRRENSPAAKKAKKVKAKKEAKEAKRKARNKARNGERVNAQLGKYGVHSKKTKAIQSKIKKQKYKQQKNKIKSEKIKKFVGSIVKSTGKFIAWFFSCIGGILANAILALFGPIIALGPAIIILLLILLAVVAFLLFFAYNAIQNAILPKNNQYILMDFMKAHGYTNVQIAAMAGNIEVDSNFNPFFSEDGYVGIGHWPEAEKEKIFLTVNNYNKTKSWTVDSAGNKLATDSSDLIYPFEDQIDIGNFMNLDSVNSEEELQSAITEAIAPMTEKAYQAQLCYLYYVTFKEKGLSGIGELGNESAFFNGANSKDLGAEYDLTDADYYEEDVETLHLSSFEDYKAYVDQQINNFTKYYYEEYYNKRIGYSQALQADVNIRSERARAFFQELNAQRLAFFYKDKDNNYIVDIEAVPVLQTGASYLNKQINGAITSNKNFNTSKYYWSKEFVYQTLQEADKPDVAAQFLNTFSGQNFNINAFENTKFPDDSMDRLLTSHELALRLANSTSSLEEFYNTYFKPGYIIYYSDHIDFSSSNNDPDLWCGIILQGPFKYDLDDRGPNFKGKYCYTVLTLLKPEVSGDSNSSNPFYNNGKWSNLLKDGEDSTNLGSPFTIQFRSCESDVALNQNVNYYLKSENQDKGIFFGMFDWYGNPIEKVADPVISEPNEPEITTPNEQVQTQPSVSAPKLELGKDKQSNYLTIMSEDGRSMYSAQYERIINTKFNTIFEHSYYQNADGTPKLDRVEMIFWDLLNSNPADEPECIRKVSDYIEKDSEEHDGSSSYSELKEFLETFGISIY